ncbi:Antiseptic resistance protein [Alloiococcus otitis]|uniref:Drug:H+ antiporter-2 (14 Spanner) (DHA2) family drug resistance MFS transporter n=1 Tax=Alloiococcus otitis ATCC 51267 TaxID=883081 RepID=K9EDU4_9LACT|nr:drug:H+ antiporter-2 (14 Spanner) (DHA2) family drug resistance MFS transporter [Alloiococcus otitis ATCC 51267]SUU81035.1 Antiseptic resistance protein [Alloiococcus otitis]
MISSFYLVGVLRLSSENKLTFKHFLANQLTKRDNLQIPRWQIFAVLFTGAVIVVLNQTAMSTALPNMIESLGIDPSLGQWIVSGYTLVKGIMVPITAFAMTKYRTRNFFILMLALFCTGSFLTGLGFNFPVVVMGTVIQGIAAGMIIPLMQTVLLTLMPVESRGTAMGVMSGVIGIGPALGPLVGGVIVDAFTWEILFYIWALITLLLVPLTWLVLPDVLPNADLTINWANIRDSLIGFGLLLFSLSVFGSSGFSSVIAWVSLLIGLVFVAKFIHFNLKADQPILNLRLFKKTYYRRAVLVATLGIVIISCLSNVIPIYVQTVRGLGASIAGLILMPAGIIKTILAPISGKLYDKVGVARIGLIGGILLLVGSLLLVTLNEASSLYLLMIYYGILSAGFGLFNIPITTAGMNIMAKEDMGHATSARQTVRQISSSFAVSLSFIIMTLVTIATSGQSVGVFQDGGPTDLNMAGVRGAFILVAIFSILAMILIFFLKDPKEKPDQ